jgi:hypothetical protein
MRSRLDELLPACDFSEVHAARVDATAAEALRRGLASPPGHGLLAALVAMRGTGYASTVAEALGVLDFDELAHDDTELVHGFVGRPWRAEMSRPFGDDASSGLRVAVGLRASPRAAGALLLTEVRVAALDRRSRQTFRLRRRLASRT